MTEDASYIFRILANGNVILEWVATLRMITIRDIIIYVFYMEVSRGMSLIWQRLILGSYWVFSNDFLFLDCNNIIRFGRQHFEQHSLPDNIMYMPKEIT